MTPWMIVLCVVAGILLLFLLISLFGRPKVRITLRERVGITAYVFGIPIHILPEDEPEEVELRECKHPKRALRAELRRQKKLEKKARKAQRKKARNAANEPAVKPNLKENLEMILHLVRKAYEVTKGKVRIRVKRFRISVATGDAASTAILYGVVTPLVASLLQIVDRGYNQIRRKSGDVLVVPDYTGTRPRADGELTVSVGLFYGVFHGLGLLRAFRAEKALAQEKALARISGASAESPAIPSSPSENNN